MPVSEAGGPLSGFRSYLKAAKSGAMSAPLEQVAEAAGKSVDELVGQLVAAGLVVPEKPREKPVYVDEAGAAFWLTRSAKGELALNSKASKFSVKKDDTENARGENEGGADSGGQKKSRRPRGRKKSDA
jgi:hypothetical protein